MGIPFSIPENWRDVNLEWESPFPISFSPPSQNPCSRGFTFAGAFSAEKQACGPEARALRGKSIGGKKICSGDLPVLPQKEAGPSAVTQLGIRNVEFGIFTSFFPFPAFRISIARPVQIMNRASWFLRAMPLLSGRAMAETQWDLQLLAGKWASPKFGLTSIFSYINLRKGKNP